MRVYDHTKESVPDACGINKEIISEIIGITSNYFKYLHDSNAEGTSVTEIMDYLYSNVSYNNLDDTIIAQISILLTANLDNDNFSYVVGMCASGFVTVTIDNFDFESLNLMGKKHYIDLLFAKAITAFEKINPITQELTQVDTMSIFIEEINRILEEKNLINKDLAYILQTLLILNALPTKNNIDSLLSSLISDIITSSDEEDDNEPVVPPTDSNLSSSVFDKVKELI